MSEMQPSRPPISRITPYTLEADDLDAVTAFYSGVLGLTETMRHDGFVGFRSEQNPTAQIVASKRGRDAHPPRFGIDVGSPAAVDEICQRAKAAGSLVLYGPVDEPWGIHRCFIEDPTGAVVSVLAHV